MVALAFRAPVTLGEGVFYATPLLFSGLSFAIPRAAGFYNIGAEGQILAGGLAAAIVGITFKNAPPLLLIPLCGLSAALVGAGLAGAAWCLKSRYGVNEVITTLLLNLTVQPLTTYFANKVFAAKGVYQAQTVGISPNAELPVIADQLPWNIEWIRAGNLNGATLIALVVIAAYAVYRRTQLSLVAEATGFARESQQDDRQGAVSWLGYDVKAVRLTAVLIGGGMAGLGSLSSVLGTNHAFVNNFSLGLGYTGIAVALILGDTASGIVAGSLVMGLLSHLMVALQVWHGVPKDLILVGQGVVLLAILLGQRRQQESYGH
jgi:simple sugar transport system permease protein